MKIAIIGEELRQAELKEKLGDGPTYVGELADAEVIFDLNLDEQAERLSDYANLDQTVIVNAVSRQLVDMASGMELKCRLMGMNALPTFIDRSLWEVSLLKEEDRAALEATLAALSVDYKWVHDRVGMVTPRVVFMIINEAYYTLQEGTANVEDINLAMKLGTNYPYGPFEWAEKVGISCVYEVLKAVHTDTNDERYKVCPLLKTAYLKNRSSN